MEEHKHTKIKHPTSSDEKEERKPVNSKKSLVFVLLVVLAVIIIIVGTILLSKYAFPDKNTVMYNNYTFQKFEGNKWMTQQSISGQIYNIPFYNNPTQVLDIPIDPNSITYIRYFKNNPNGTVYISIDPSESSKVVLAGVEYARLLGDVYNIYNMNVKSAINTKTNITTDYPVMTCKNQSTNRFIIVQQKSDKNLVTVKGNCVTMEYKNATESIRVADAYAFGLLNIIRYGQ